MAMAVYLFPFEVIPKESRIVVWGAGEVGRSYVRQILKTHYCELVLWVDKKSNQKNGIFDVSPCEEIANAQFDYVVIAVLNIKHSEEIKRTLLQYDVAEEKIIYVHDRSLLNSDSAYSLEKFCFTGQEMTLKIIKEFLDTPERNFEFFDSIINEINTSEKKEQIKEILQTILFSEQNVMICIVIIRIMYHCRMIDRDVMRRAVEVAGQMRDEEERYWFLTEIGLMEFECPDAVYEEYYTERRYLMVKTAEELCGYRREKIVPCEENSKIAILAMILYDRLNSITRMVALHANELSRQGKEITIFLTEPFIYSYGEGVMEPFSCYKKSSMDYQKEQKEYLLPNVKICYARGNGIRERMNNCVDDIIDFQPKVILDFTAKHSYLSPILTNYFPVVCVSTGGHCTTASFHKYICRDKRVCIELNKIYNSIPEEKMLELPNAAVIPLEKQMHERADYGFEENDFVLVTVGNRLEIECTDDFVDEVCSLLKKYENIKWILVGDTNSYIANKYTHLLQEGKIVFWGYESNLMSFYKMCNAYINPNRAGGGTSIVWAMVAGLPVLATDFPGDIVYWMDNSIHGNYHDLIDYTEKLCLDRELCLELGIKAKNKVKECSWEMRIKKLIEACEAIVFD